MTIHLIRHASAGRRGSAEDEMARPLDPTGRDQAARIAEALAPFRVERILSSPAVRCLSTVEPLSDATGTVIEVVADLAEGRPAHAVVAMINRLTSAGSSAVICSHGDVIPDVLEELASSGIPMAGNGCAKGSIWELRVRDGRVAEARYRGRP